MTAGYREVSLPVDRGGLRALPAMNALAALLAKLGGTTTISQADLDAIAGLFVVEGFDHAGNLILTLGRPAKGSQS